MQLNSLLLSPIHRRESEASSWSWRNCVRHKVEPIFISHFQWLTNSITHTHTHTIHVFHRKRRHSHQGIRRLHCEVKKTTYRFYAVKRVCNYVNNNRLKKAYWNTHQIFRLKMELQEAKMTISSLQLDVDKEKKVFPSCLSIDPFRWCDYEPMHFKGKDECSREMSTSRGRPSFLSSK